jgi:aspartyl-tRNA(Asn)/glutamyl-tRNA(Gln) amidotransferase subunit C
MNKEEVQKLAKLARIDIPDSEAETLSREFESILKYVGEIKEAKLPVSDMKKEDFVLRNVMREDNNPHESGVHTEALMAEVPESAQGYVKVKKIL